MPAFIRLAVGIALSAAMISVANGQSKWTPYAAEEVQHDSNLFFLPSSGPVPQGNDGPTFGDDWLRSIAGFDGTYLWGRQKFFLTAEGRRFDYDHFSYLDHTEYLLHPGMDWQLTNLLDGTIDYRRERSAVPFTELLDSTKLFLQTEDIGTASINVHVAPEWLLKTEGTYRNLDSPRPGALDLSLRESSVDESIRYLGVTHLSAGLDLKYLSGKYKGDPVTPTSSYDQSSAEFAAEYAVSGRTHFDGSLGYTHRSELGEAFSGLTGAVAYQHQITGKTSVDLALTRAVNSYVTTAGSEVDSSAALKLGYQATYKILVNAGYMWTENKFPSPPQLAGIPVTAVEALRLDHVQASEMEVKYQALRWLSVRVYARYQTRTSNLADFQYEATSYGIEFQAKEFNPN